MLLPFDPLGPLTVPEEEEEDDAFGAVKYTRKVVSFPGGFTSSACSK